MGFIWAATPHIPFVWASTDPVIAGVLRGIEQARLGEGAIFDGGGS